jgi:hypothetical protein
MIALLSRPGAPPPPAAILFTILLVLVLLPLLTSLTNRLMGIPALYEAFPADPADPIEENLGWPQVQFDGLRGHSPMSMKFGRRCLHLKQPFPFQPAWWRGPASIPWREIRIEQELREDGWSFRGSALFRLGNTGRTIRLRGKVARRLQDRVKHGGGDGRPPAPLRPR